MKSKSLFLSIILLLFFTSIAYSQSAYLKIGDIKGESTERSHKDWINIESFSQGLAKAAIDRASGRQRRAADFEDVMVSKKVDKATPQLMELCAKGQVLPELELDMVTANGRLYYKITLNNVRVVSIHTTSAGDAEGTLVDEVAFSFSKITWEYWDSVGNKTETSYNLKTGM